MADENESWFPQLSFQAGAGLSTLCLLVCGDWVILLRFLNHLWRLIRIMHLLWWRVRRAPSRNTVGPMSVAFWGVNRTTFTLCTCQILSIYINYNKRSLLVLLLNYWLLLIFNWFKHSNAIYGIQELRSKLKIINWKEKKIFTSFSSILSSHALFSIVPTSGLHFAVLLATNSITSITHGPDQMQIQCKHNHSNRFHHTGRQSLWSPRVVTSLRGWWDYFSWTRSKPNSVTVSLPKEKTKS